MLKTKNRSLGSQVRPNLLPVAHPLFFVPCFINIVFICVRRNIGTAFIINDYFLPSVKWQAVVCILACLLESPKRLATTKHEISRLPK